VKVLGRAEAPSGATQQPRATKARGQKVFMS